MWIDEEVQCPICGTMFVREPRKPNQRYCSFDCSKKAELESKKLSAQQNKSLITHRSIEPPKKPKKKKKSNMESIVEIDRLAKEEGLTYGQYVGKYGV